MTLSFAVFNNPFSLTVSEETQLIGNMAHELRHIWQHEYKPEIMKDKAVGRDSFLNHAEIDADGFAIWYLSILPGLNIYKAAEIVFPKGKKNHPAGYMNRMLKAKEIKTEFDVSPMYA